MFYPVNDKCVDCKQKVGLQERQEIAWDEKGDCRRRCGFCIDARNSEAPVKAKSTKKDKWRA